MRAALLLLVSACAASSSASELSSESLAGSEFSNEHGKHASISSTGSIDRNNEFFKAFGTSGRSCETCHLLEDGVSLRASTARAQFDATEGRGVLFRAFDAANRPDADVSTVEARRKAYSLLLTRGVFRATKAPPANAEFVVESVEDPYGAPTADKLALYRRPLPLTNMRFATALTWDGRAASIEVIANAATVSHGQASAGLTAAQQKSIATFSKALYTAQTEVNGIRLAGPEALASVVFALNKNAPQAPPAAPVTMNVFTLFAGDTPQARGQKLFNERGCARCHSALDVGSNDHSGTDGFAYQTIGSSGESPLGPANAAEFLARDLPVYTLKNRTTGKKVRTHDPGRGLITGKWNDIGKFKTPILRGLASRAPYFHNGSAQTLADVVNFYDATRALALTKSEKSDLTTFLASL